MSRRSEKLASQSYIIRGRQFTHFDIRTIQQCVDEYYRMGRTRISLAVCERLDWKQPNGWPKDRACRDALIKLAKKRLIKLPSRPKKLAKEESNRPPKPEGTFVYRPISPVGDVTLEFAKGNKNEAIWNSLVKLHHYLGHKVVVGRCIKYVVKYKNETVGAISFSSASWNVGLRNELLKKLEFTKNQILDGVINNNRFLILPSVNIPNLASQVLSLAARQVTKDWTEYYHIIPKVIETFVQPSRFHGTCYKAANWVDIGRTKGYAKRGAQHFNSQEPKRIFLYGLDSTLRKKLLTMHQSTKDSGNTNGTREYGS